MGRFTARYLLALLLLNLTACSSMQAVNVQQAMRDAQARGIDYGSLVEVRTLDGERARFRVVDMTPEGLGGKPGFFAYANMESLKVEQASSRGSDETWAYVLGALGIAALIALVANADSVSVCSPSPCPQPE